MKERIVRAIAGIFILVSVLLAITIHIHWLYITAFVGLNLLQSSVTQFCPLERILDLFDFQSGKDAG